MISPTRYNLNFFIPPPPSLVPLVRSRYREGFGGSDRLVKEDGFRNAPIFPLDKVSPVPLQPVFSLEQDFDIFLTPLFSFPPACPQILCQTILNQVTSFYVCMCTLCFHRAAFHGRQVFLILGSRQRWQKQPGQSGNEPGSHPAIQPGSHSLQWSPSSSQEEPIIQERYQTMNHLRQSSHPLLSPTLTHSLMPGRPPACCCLHLK